MTTAPTLPPALAAKVAEIVRKRSYNLALLPAGWTQEDVRGWNRAVEEIGPAVTALIATAEASLTEARETNGRLNRRVQELEHKVIAEDRRWGEIDNIVGHMRYYTGRLRSYFRSRDKELQGYYRDFYADRVTAQAFGDDGAEGFIVRYGEKWDQLIARVRAVRAERDALATALRESARDGERLDWLEKSMHVAFTDAGEPHYSFFCPMFETQPTDDKYIEVTIRNAIDSAISATASEEPAK
jgi:hypothetical protein